MSYQLVNDQRSGVKAYNMSYHDPATNRTLKNDSGALTSYSYNAANELTLTTPPTGQPTTSSFDANGNLIVENSGGQLTIYSWDGENRLTGVVYPTGAPDTMVYSSDGMRQQKLSSSGTLNAVWDEENLLQEKDQNQATQAQYTDSPGYWGGLVSQRRSGVSQFYGFDTQSNTRILQSILGALTDSYLYRAFGEEVVTTGSSVNSLRFGGAVGYYRDLASRFYIRARHYEPLLGRWMSRDPLGQQATALFLDGPNPYGYVQGSPPSRVDASGLISLGCLVCGYAMDEWAGTCEHGCNHPYAHCMICCVGTRFGGKTRADWIQGIQAFSHGDKNLRWRWCNTGRQAAAKHGLTCDEACQQRWPFIPYPWRCPYPTHKPTNPVKCKSQNCVLKDPGFKPLADCKSIP